jgi:predicted O-methyltransferase YrrM
VREVLTRVPADRNNRHMNPIARLSRYASAWARFGELERLTRDRCSLEEIVDGVFGYADGFFAPIQVREEILGALRIVEQAQPRYVIEVGTAGGGTLLMWSRVAHPQATIVTIDLPGGDFGGGSSILRMPLFKRLPLPSQTVHFIRADSHAPQTIAQTEQLLGGNPVDFLFIDADHTESGVRADYQNYSKLVRPGGLIGFHDIAVTLPEYGVRKLWTELAAHHEHQEFIRSRNPFGIGVLTHK